MRLLCFLAVLSAACSSSTARVDLTMTFDGTVSDTALGTVTTLVVIASGDETDSFPIALGRAAMRMERTVYAPARATKSLALAVEAVDGSGHVIAMGSSGSLSVRQRGTITAGITLTAGAPTGADAAMAPVDMAHAPPPAFVQAEFASSGPDTAFTQIPVSAPSATMPGMLLVAMVGGINANDASPVIFNAPSGWSTLSTTSSGSPLPATATWFWKIATAAEPPSYTFTRTGTQGQMLVLLAAYSGIVGTTTAGIFDAPTAAANDASTTASSPPIHTGIDFDLYVMNGFAPDDFNATWSNPAGLEVRQAASVLSADEGMGAHGDISSFTSTLGNASRTLVLSVGLRGM